MKTKTKIIIGIGILIAIVLVLVFVYRAFIMTTSLSALIGQDFIPLKMDNQDITCSSNQDCKDAILNKFPSATNLDVICLNQICSVKAIKSGQEEVE